MRMYTIFYDRDDALVAARLTTGFARRDRRRGTIEHHSGLNERILGEDG